MRERARETKRKEAENSFEYPQPAHLTDRSPILRLLNLPECSLRIFLFSLRYSRHCRPRAAPPLRNTSLVKHARKQWYNIYQALPVGVFLLSDSARSRPLLSFPPVVVVFAHRHSHAPRETRFPSLPRTVHTNGNFARSLFRLLLLLCRHSSCSEKTSATSFETLLRPQRRRFGTSWCRW